MNESIEPTRPSTAPPIVGRRLLRFLLAALIAIGSAAVALPANALPRQSGALDQTVVASAAPGIGATATSTAIVGSWRGDVYRDNGAIERDVSLQFFPNGTVTTVGGVGIATGTWSHLGGQAFTYRTTASLDFGTLEVTGYVVIKGATLAGVGSARALDPAGQLLGTGWSVITARRQ